MKKLIIAIHLKLLLSICSCLARDYGQSISIGKHSIDTIRNVSDQELLRYTLVESDAESDRLNLSYIKSQEAIYDWLHRFDWLHDNLSIKEIILLEQYANVHSNEYSYLLIHDYESFEELRLSAGPSADQERCIRQLDYLSQRLSMQKIDKQHSRDLNLAQLLDTFGHTSSGQFLGSTIWEGSYRECLRIRILSPEGDSGTRYCFAHMHDVGWPREVDSDNVAIQIGVCLPESCDSTNYKNKLELIGRLIDHNAREVDRDRFQVSRLYCLPDEESLSRSLWRQTHTMLALIGATCWIAILIYATAKDYLRGREDNEAARIELRTSSRALKSFSIIHNFNKLFTTKESCDISTSAKSLEGEHLAGKNNCIEGVQRRSPAASQAITNLSIIESIKVLAMCYVILGHVLMIITGGVTDGKQLKMNSAFLIANMTPAFAVNSFFAITGILTAYLILKQTAKPPFSGPIKWIVLILYRYMRLMPLYLIVVLFSKTLAKYTNSGPFWDYATSSQSHRRHCEQESILWTLLFVANFKKPLQHCLPGGWYLANDFQFFLITPFFLIPLAKYPKLGRKLILVSILVSYMITVMSIMTVEADDFRPIVNFDQIAFKFYVTNLSHTYTLPYYRIPAYLCGLYIGYLIHQREQKRHECESRGSKKLDTVEANPAIASFGKLHDYHIMLVSLVSYIAYLIWRSAEGPTHILIAILLMLYITSVHVVLYLIITYRHSSKDIDRPGVLDRHGSLLGVILIIGCCATPFMCSSLSVAKTTARLMVAIVLPGHNLTFALAIGLIILSGAVSHGRSDTLVNRILTAPQWKVPSRLSLCALLVNVEVITHIADGREYLHPITNQYLWAMNLLSIVMTYIVSVFFSVLFELPLQGTLGHILSTLKERDSSYHQLKPDRSKLIDELEHQLRSDSKIK